LGDHYGGFTPFQFEVTGLLKPGENSLVLMVDNTRHQDDVPTVNTDWWNYGGITRDVYLADMPSDFIRDYSLHLDPRHPDRIVGSVVAVGPVDISIPAAGLHWTAQPGVPFSIPAPGLKKWSPGDPFLYDVHLRSAGDSVSDRIGFRTISVRGQDILLNGKSIFLKGICIHDENPLIPGRNRGEGDLRMLLEWAKELHCNYVRLAHYPHNEAMLRLADEMGLLVWAEIPVYWTISFDNPGTFAEAAGQLTGMISRDKNRASVVIWSVGNETPVTAPRLRFMGNLADSARALDSTRLVTAAMEVRTQGMDMTVDDPLAAKLDLVSFNEYRGWYSGGLNDIEGVHFHIANQKPVVISEFGGEALGGFHGDSTTRWTEEYQEALYVHQLRLLSTLEGLRGMTPWILVDFRSPRRQNSVYQNGWNRKGLISSDGQKKKAFFVVRSFYDHIHD
jgi:beta-glucuronidase